MQTIIDEAEIRLRLMAEKLGATDPRLPPDRRLRHHQQAVAAIDFEIAPFKSFQGDNLVRRGLCLLHPAGAGAGKHG